MRGSEVPRLCVTMMVAWAVVSHSSTARGKEPDVDPRKLYGLPQRVAVAETPILAKARMLKEKAGHVLYDDRGQAIDTHFRKVADQRKSRVAAKRERVQRRAERRAAVPRDLFAGMGLSRDGRIARADFRRGGGLYQHLDVTGRGYVTLTDVEEFVKTLPFANARLKAARFIAKFDRDRNGSLSPGELPDAGHASLAVCASGERGNVEITVQRLALCLVEKARARREAERRARGKRAKGEGGK